MFSHEEVVQVLGTNCLVESLDLLPNGHTRIGTKLLYPDGSGIDLFVERHRFFVDENLLSDFGNTFSLLEEYQVRPWQKQSRMATLEEAVGVLDVEVHGDRLSLNVQDLTDMPASILKLGQACIRASCMIFTRRSAQQTTFTEQVKSVIADTKLPFEENVPLRGPFGVPVTVDFRVDGPHKHSSILTISGANQSSSHVQANEVFRKWSDLKDVNSTDNFLTIFDEHQGAVKPEDLSRLEKVSDILPIANRSAIQRFLAA